MKVEFSLLSVLSAALVIALLVSGGDVSLFSLSVDVSQSEISLHPVFAVVYDLPSANGMCFGNVIVIDSDRLRMSWTSDLVEHEYNHAQQFHSLGLWIYPLSLVLPIEGGAHTSLDLRSANRAMWQSPAPPLWWFLTISMPPTSF